MRANIAKVIAAFNAGRSAVGDSKRTCSTDGRTIWSYDMPIAQRMSDGHVEVISRDAAPTRTTRAQIDAIANAHGIPHIATDYHRSVPCLTGHKPHTFRDKAGRDGHMGRSNGNRSGLKVPNRECPLCGVWTVSMSDHFDDRHMYEMAQRKRNPADPIFGKLRVVR